MSKPILPAQSRLLRASAIAILALLAASVREASALPLPRNLTLAEKKVVEAAKRGDVADFRTGNKELDDPARGIIWGPERTIRAEVIEALAVGDAPLAGATGVNIFGAKIIGQLKFFGARIPHPLDLSWCFIQEPIVLAYADVFLVSLEGSDVGVVNAEGLRDHAGLFLRSGFRAAGAVRLPGARIDGNLDCNGGTFGNAGGMALDAAGATIEGDVYLSHGFHAEGEVRLLGARIAGQVNSSGGNFENPKGEALGADGATVNGSVFFSNGFHSKGEVRLNGAKIGGQLDCEGGILENAKGYALAADSTAIAGTVALRNGFRAYGEVHLSGANVRGQLDCSGATFENPGGRAISADGATIEEGVFLSEGFHARGEVSLVGARIGGDLSCREGTFENHNAMAFDADHTTVDGSVLLNNGFHADGGVRFNNAKIGGQFSCFGGSFKNNDGVALNLENTNVTTTLLLGGLSAPLTGIVNLGYARVGDLADDEESWPQAGKLVLDGFVYGRVLEYGARDRLRWLMLQPGFRPQTYEQLIKVLREMGHERDAIAVAIAEQEDLRERGGLGPLSRAKNWLLDKTIKYGYESWRAFLLLLVAWLLGTAMFWWAKRRGLMMPSEKEAYDSRGDVLRRLPPGYPRFHAWLYALDLFVPGIDLHQKSKWSLHERSDRWYWPWELASVVYFVACWILTLIGVGAVTGLIKPH